MEQLTAEALVSFFQGDGLIATCLNLLAFLAGIFVNIRNQIKREDISIKDYIVVHGKRTLASVGSLFAVFFSMLLMDGDAPIYGYFTAALATDYLVNRTPRKDEV